MVRRDQAREWLAVREREGLTYKALSARVGVPVTTLAHWAWRLRREAAQEPGTPTEFVELVPSSRALISDTARVEIITRSERRVIVDAGIDVIALARIVLAVERC
jgi:transposase